MIKGLIIDYTVFRKIFAASFLFLILVFSHIYGMNEDTLPENITKHLACVQADRQKMFKGVTYAFDVETTGTRSYHDKILQITFLRLVCGVPTGDVLNLYLNPGSTRISHYAAKAHKLTKEFLKDKPTFQEVWPKIEAFIGENPTLFAYNAAFDMRFLKQAIEGLGEGVEFECNYKCVLQMARRDHGRVTKKIEIVSPEKIKARVSGLSKHELDGKKSEADSKSFHQKSRRIAKGDKHKENGHPNPKAPSKKKKPKTGPSLALGSVADRLGIKPVKIEFTNSKHAKGSQPHARAEFHDAFVDTGVLADVTSMMVHNTAKAASQIAGLR